MIEDMRIRGMGDKAQSSHIGRSRSAALALSADGARRW